MLRFFRTLRQRFLTENRFSKYLLYAVGEILLVVIGILIALQIDTWNEWRKDRVKEQEVLAELAENLERNMDELNIVMQQTRRQISSRTIASTVLEQNAPYHDSLATHFLFAGLTLYKPALSRSGYELLQNQGYDIITSITLRKGIVELFESTYATYERNLNGGNVDPLLEDMTRYFRKHFKLMDNPYRRVPLDYTMLINDNYLIESLKAIANWENVLKNDNAISLDETQKVLRLINEALDGE